MKDTSHHPHQLLTLVFPKEKLKTKTMIINDLEYTCKLKYILAVFFKEHKIGINVLD